MGMFDFLDEEKRKKFDKGKDLYYHSAEEGIEMMEENAQTGKDFETAAAKQWELIKEKSGRDKAFQDPKYKKLMKKAAETED